MGSADQELTVEILGLDQRGHGVATQGDDTLHVAGTVPGDRVAVRIDHRSPHHPDVWGSLTAVHSRGPTFTEPPCPHVAPLRGRCGGCPLLHLTHAAQLEWKREQVVAQLEELPVAVESVHSTGPVTGYRARSNYVVGEHQGEPMLGSWAPRSHDLARMTGCQAVRPGIARLATALTDLLVERPALPRAALRYVTIRAATSGDLLVDFVIDDEHASGLEDLFDQTMALDGVAGVSVSVNQSGGNAIRVAESNTVRGQETVIEQVGEIGLTAAAASFTQLNGPVAAAMYRQGVAWLADHVANSGVVLDLYSGLGGLGMTLAKLQPDLEILGAESWASSVRLARKGAEHNQLADRCRFLATDLRRESIPLHRVTGVFVNPPRRGIDERQMEVLTGLSVPLVYMSCNPASFARDALRLMESNLNLTDIQAWDMLPQTTHTETIALFLPA